MHDFPIAAMRSGIFPSSPGQWARSAAELRVFRYAPLDGGGPDLL